MKAERMQLIASAVQVKRNFHPKLVVYNGIGFRLGEFVADFSYSSIEEALNAAKVAIEEYNKSGRMVSALEKLV